MAAQLFSPLGMSCSIKERKKVKLLSRVPLFASPWSVTYQTPQSMGFSRQEYWSGLPFPSPGDLPNPRIKPRSPAMQTALTYSFPNLEPVRCSMSSSNCCFLTCIQVSQETGKVVCYSHLLKNFPQFIVIHRIKSFSIVSEAEVYVFLEFPSFSMIQWMLAI